MIVKPILDITEKIKLVADGDYEQQIPVDSDTELGNLSKAFNVMSVKLKEFEESNLEELKAQKTRIETIIKSMNDGLVILNESKYVILANDAASQILGIPEHKLIGKNAGELSETNVVMRGLLDSLEQEDSGSTASEMEEEQSKNLIKIERKGRPTRVFHTGCN